MISRETLSYKMLTLFTSWNGEQSQTEKIIKKLNKYKNEPSFREQVEKFQYFINSRDCRNLYRYEKKKILPNSTFRFLFSGMHRVVATPEFVDLNKQIQEILATAPFHSEAESNHPSTSSSTALSMCKIAWENKWLIIIPIIVFAYASRANAKEAECETKSKGLTPFYPFPQNYFEHEICTNQMAPVIDYQFILEKISLDESYVAKLTPEDAFDKRSKMASYLLSLAEEEHIAEKIKHVMNSKDFKFIVVEDFSENPYGVGLYSAYRNELFVKDRASYFCSDYQTTNLHELHHGDIAETRSDNDPIKKCQGITIDECDKITTQPFSSSEEQQALNKAISKGQKRVLKDFAKLHEKWLKNNLTDEVELASYEKYKSVLVDYQPRCIAHVIYPRSHEYQYTLNNLKNGKPITRNGKPFFPLHFENTPQGLIIFGNFATNLEKTENRVTAFIQDTQYIKTDFLQNYGPNPNLRTTELDAEINGDKDKVVETFYPEVKDYHTQFRRKHKRVIDVSENETKPSLINNFK